MKLPTQRYQALTSLPENNPDMYCFYGSNAPEQELRLIKVLREAPEKGEIVPFFQPIVQAEGQQGTCEFAPGDSRAAFPAAVEALGDSLDVIWR